jgi:multimeric flavodoxin WrbA
MKILALISSHRKKGNTSTVVTLIKEHMEHLASKDNDFIQFETLFLSDYTIKHCTGCRSCYHRGLDACPLKDDMPQIKLKIKNADAIIFAGPVYINAVNATMKGLIDRLVHLCHLPELFDTCALIIITTHKSGIRHAIRTVYYACTAWGIHILGSKGFPMEDSSREEIDTMYHKDIVTLAEKLYFGVKKKKYLYPSLAQLVVFNIHKHYKGDPAFADDHPHEYEYWKKKGWINPQKTFFIEHRANFLKVGLAKIISRIICLRFGD